MKRVLAALLCAALLLTGCGTREPEAPERTPLVTEIPAALRLPELSESETEAMSRYMAANRALIDGDRLYTLDYDERWQPVLAVYTLQEGKPAGREILAADCVPEYLTLWEKRLYYVNQGALERLDPETGERTVLREGCRSLQIQRSALYYSDENGAFYASAIDGSGALRLLPGPCAYPYVLGGLILYQDESEGESLWLCDPADGRRQKLAEGRAYAPLLVGRTLYFTQKTEEGSFVARLDPAGELRHYGTVPLRGAAELFPGEEGPRARILPAGEGESQQLLRLAEPSEISLCSFGGYRLCDYVGGGWQVDAAYEAGGRLLGFVLTDPEGTETAYMGGSVR